MNLIDYDQELSQFDWYYQYSDDHRVFSREDQKHKRLIALSKSDPDRARLYQAYSAAFTIHGAEALAFLQDVRIDLGVVQ